MGEPRNDENGPKDRLRKEAERRAGARTSRSPEISADELVHELEVHQIELEMQNEELRLAQQELELSRDQYAELYDFAPVGYVTLDGRGRIRQINLTGARMLGVERAYLLGQPLLNHIAREYWWIFHEHLRTCIGTSQEATCEVAMTAGNGDLITVQLHSVPFEDGKHGALCRTAVTDITARKHAEQQLALLNQTLELRVADRTDLLEQRTVQLQALARRLTQAEHRERRRLAKLLHDHLQQLLVAARITTATARRRADHEEMQRLLERIDELLDESIGASRSLTRDLCPPVLYDVGLLGALAWLARSMEEKQRLKIELKSEAAVEPDDQEMKVLVFEAVREALFNVAKHAGVPEAKVTVARTKNDEIVAEVSDKGVGFDLAALSGDGDRLGFGLFSSRQRLELMGGRFEIDSAPGEGTRVTIGVPAGEQDEADAAARRSCQSEHFESSGNRPLRPRLIRILLADDHEIIRHGLANALMDEPDMDVIGEAGDGQEAVEMALQLRPDVILMDISMPRLDGIEATRRIKTELPDTQVIGLSMHEESDAAQAMCDAGACAYLSKNGCSEELLRTIRTG